MSDLHSIAARACDVLAGLSYPSAWPVVRSPYARGAVPLIYTVEDAVNVAPWPGVAAEYNADGTMVRPDRAFLAQNFATGYALGREDVRAFLLGLLCKGTSTPERRRALYEAACRLAGGELQALRAELTQLRSSVSSSTIASAPTQPPLPQRYMDAAGKALDVVRVTPNGLMEPATGNTQPDQENVIGVLARASAGGEDVPFYPLTWPYPIPASLAWGRVYRLADGSLGPWSAVGAGDVTLQIGVAADVDLQLVSNLFDRTK